MSFLPGRRSRNVDGGIGSDELSDPASSRSVETERTLTAPHVEEISKAQLKRATRTRKIFALMTSFFLAISVIFLIIVEVANTSPGKVRSSIYFIRLDLSQIVPASIPDSGFLNTFAQTVGLHDFYQVGLWNFCEGYVADGITNCSKPKALYWFNPFEIIVSELFAGATIALPADITNVLKLLKLASQWMFGLFLTGTVTEFVMIFITPLAIYSRWASLTVAPLTFLAALCTTIATVLATALFLIFKKAASSQSDLNIGATIGTKIFVFMWIATAFAILAFLIQMGLCCCCASRRDVKKGTKKGSKKAGIQDGAYSTEKPPRKGMFRRKK